MRIRRSIVPIAAVAAVAFVGLVGSLLYASAARPTLEREQPSIVFVCMNGVAMSVWSALTFDRLAEQHGLSVRATSRAATPSYTQVPLRMQLALALDGFRVGSYRPHVISADDVRRAQRVILVDTELPPAASIDGAAIESWSGFPPMREQYFASRAALLARVEDLVARLAAASADPH